MCVVWVVVTVVFFVVVCVVWVVVFLVVVCVVGLAVVVVFLLVEVVFTEVVVGDVLRVVVVEFFSASLVVVVLAAFANSANTFPYGSHPEPPSISFK